MALTLLNRLQGKWETVQGSLTADLTSIQNVFNQHLVDTEPFHDMLVPPNGGTGSCITLEDGAVVGLDASLGTVFTLASKGSRTIAAPLRPTAGQFIWIAHTATGGNRTLALATGVTGGFAFGTTIAALSATTSTLTDYIGCVYNSVAARWHVVVYTKGF